MSTQATAHCDTCGWTGGPYRTTGIADYSLRRHSCTKHRAELARQARVAARIANNGPRRDCHHPNTTHHHGTHAAYVLDKCRCRPCRDASAAYERHRHKQRAYGRQAYVDATPAREHVRALMGAGMGWKRIAHAANLYPSTLWKLLYGDPTRGQAPSARVRPATAEKLLAVTLDLAPGLPVDSTGTRRRLQALVHQGWSVTRLATQLGSDRQKLYDAIDGSPVHRATADSVSALYDRLWDQPPPEHNKRERIAASRARRWASQEGWAGPLAWDDDTIDDPTATPDTGPADTNPGGRRIHVDDIEWLLTHQDYTRDGISTRLGVRWDSIDTALRRANRPDLRDRITRNTTHPLAS